LWAEGAHCYDGFHLTAAANIVLANQLSALVEFDLYSPIVQENCTKIHETLKSKKPLRTETAMENNRPEPAKPCIKLPVTDQRTTAEL